MRPDLSIHDVMPETLERVGEQLDLIAGYGARPVTLLVVPGRDWSNADIDHLRQWQAAGHRLAGHGWSHQAASIRGLRHRLHSALISRDCAEHLALDASGIVALMNRCREWFVEHGFSPPGLYVPPAWAVGSVGTKALRGTGFDTVETLTGWLDVASGRFRRAALVGFEARNRWQVPVLKATNALNRQLARRLPLRIALHPDDHRLPLAGDLKRWLSRTSA